MTGSLWMRWGKNLSNGHILALTLTLILNLLVVPMGGARAEAKPEFSFNELISLVENRKAMTVEQTLALLPDELLSNYVLVYNSRSLQVATPLNPRAILHGKSAEFVITFNGDPSLPGYDHLEIMEFNHEKREFEFHDIKFSRDGRTKPVLTANPRRCMGCHRPNSRPNWDHYFFWPGLYGSEDDFLSYHPGQSSPPAVRETQWYRQFLAKKEEEQSEGKGRYRFLKERQPLYGDFLRPNLSFGLMLRDLNFKSFARAIRDDENLFPFRFAIFAALHWSCHQNLAEFFPPEYSARVQEKIRDLATEVNLVNQRGLDAKFARSLRIIGREAVGRAAKYRRESDYYDLYTANLRFLLEGFSDFDVKQWSLEFAPRTYNFDEGITGLLAPLKEELFSNEAERKLTADLKSPSGIFHVDCQALQERHRREVPWTAQNLERLHQALNGE